MELRQLRYFCAIVDAGGFSRAAQRARVAQPSLSQQIRKLEDELGVRLFDRVGRGVRITDPGRALLPRARAVLRELEAARGEVERCRGDVAGAVALGAIPTVAPYLLPAVLGAFARAWPRAQVSVVEEITPLLLDKLAAGSLDLVLAALPLPPRRRGFTAHPLLTERVFAVLPIGHRLAGRRSVGLRELQREPFLLLRDGHCFRDAALAACRRARLHPRVVFESGQFSSILGMVAAGLGVSLVPAMAVSAHPGCCFRPLRDESARRTLAMIAVKSRSLTRAQQALCDQLKAVPSWLGPASSAACG